MSHLYFFFFSSRRRHTRWPRDWSSDVCSSDLYNIAGEHLGTYPDEEIPSKLGGVGRMCSFGEGISMTPLQVGALVTAIANGGTMYYLQHPSTAAAITNFQPIVKRHLNIAGLIPEISDGMAGAVEYGTARRLL